MGLSASLTGAVLSPREALEQDLEREYFGRPFPTAEEVLSGQWDAMMPPSPDPYYLSQRDRYGANTLEKGWHAFRLLVADPVFWKDDKEPDGPLQIRMDVLNPAAQSYMPVEAAQFSANGSGH